MSKAFNERFAVDNVEDGGSGSFVLQADAVKDRFESHEESRKGIIEQQPHEIAHRMSMRDLYENDAVGIALANGQYDMAGEMLQSIRIIKHEEGNPKCPHC